jgi:6 kDa early secretory antigenic target
MDGGIMKYSFGAIEGLAADINNRVGAVESRIADMDTKINQLTDMWEGSANVGFVQTKTAWKNAATDLNRVLKQIQIAVTQTNSDAQQTESLNARRWNA